jgi:hypothetical protein
MLRDIQIISKKTNLQIENWKYVAYKMLSSILVKQHEKLFAIMCN